MIEDMTRFLLDQFNILADAPGGVQRLRELILQLAVTGRLGTGDHREKSLSSLLEKTSINQNKSRKKGVDDESKYIKLNWKIPENWSWSSLGNICQKISNGYSGHQNKNYSEYPLTRIETISLGFVDFNRVGYIHNPTSDIIEKYSIKKGDILMSHINSDKHLGKTAFFNDDRILLHGTNLLLIRLFSEIASPSFVNIYFNFIRHDGFFLSIAQHAIAQSSINQSKLIPLPVPLPPLAEQKRIVEKVDSLMALCDDLEAKQTQKHTHLVKLGTGSLTTLQQSTTQEELVRWWGHLQNHFGLIFDCVENVEALRQTILQLAVTGRLGTGDERDEQVSNLLKRITFEKENLIKRGRLKVSKANNNHSHEQIFDIPINWKWVRLDDIVSKVGSGSTPLGGKTAYSDSGIKFIRSQNVWNDKLFLNNVVYISKEIHQSMAGTHVQPNDVLLNITGASIGRSCVVPDIFDTGNVNQHVCIIRPILKELCQYLHLFLISKPLTGSIIIK